MQTTPGPLKDQQVFLNTSLSALLPAPKNSLASLPETTLKNSGFYLFFYFYLFIHFISSILLNQSSNLEEETGRYVLPGSTVSEMSYVLFNFPRG